MHLSAVSCCVAFLGGHLQAFYVKLKRLRRIWRIAMQFDELLDTFMDEKATPLAVSGNLAKSAGPMDQPNPGDSRPVGELKAETIAEHRKRLAALVAGGKALEYIGHNLSLHQIESLPDGEIEELYSQHETRLGALMTGSVGRALLELYGIAVSKAAPILASHTHPGRTVYVDRPALVADLEQDPVAGRILNSITCDLYHSYGWSLGPVAVAAITVKHIHLIDEDPVRPTHVNDGGRQPTGGESAPTSNVQPQGGFERS